MVFEGRAMKKIAEENGYREERRTEDLEASKSQSEKRKREEENEKKIEGTDANSIVPEAKKRKGFQQDIRLYVKPKIEEEIVTTLCITNHNHEFDDDYRNETSHSPRVCHS